ncbi:unnamed protein product [Lupinus luteus]|uniref:C3H1-type domain-containing protein n=1 Tax=Lupinus luteus TaxID=3873 RepID=A0AAV1Y1A9_LUPLU
MDIKSTWRNEERFGRNSCSYWLAGRCDRNPCRFLHSVTPSTSSSYYTSQYNKPNNAYPYTRKPHSHYSDEKMLSNPNGITLPVGTNKLYSGSTYGTVRTWDCHTSQCTNVRNCGSEVNSLISEGPWIFVGLHNAIKIALELTLDGPRGKFIAMVVGDDTLFAGAHATTRTTVYVFHGLLALSRMSDAKGKLILFSSSANNSVRIYELFLEMGRLFAKQVVRSIEIGPNGLFFTGDGTYLLIVWRWLVEPKVAST